MQDFEVPTPAASPIPRVIHQTWKRREVPEHLRAWHESLKEQNPSWTVHVWSDEDNRALIEQHFRWFLPTYDAYPLEIMRVDVVRPFLLYHYGGIYADLDVQGLHPFDRLLSANLPRELVLKAPKDSVGLVLGLEKRILTAPVCANSVMGSRAGHPFWPHVFRALEARAQQPRPWFMPRENFVLNTTGPEVIHRELRKHWDQLSDVLLVAPEVLCPLGWWQSSTPKRLKNAIAAHQYGSSWMPKHSVLWQRMLRALVG